MLNTQEVLEKIENYTNGSLKIARTTLFDYAARGILKKIKKTSNGRAKGVKTYWKENTPEIVLAVLGVKNFSMVSELSLKEIQYLFGILRFKNSKENKKFSNLFADYTKIEDKLDEWKKQLTFKSKEDAELFSSFEFDILTTDRFRILHNLKLLATQVSTAHLVSKDLLGPEHLTAYLSLNSMAKDKLLSTKADIKINKDIITINYLSPIRATIKFTKDAIEMVSFNKK